MIGRSLVIFQRGNNKNEIFETNSWSFALSKKDKDVEKDIIKASKREKWEPAAIVSDAEVEAIVNATNCGYPKEPGYHEWASDSVWVINASDDPNLYNPAKTLADKRKAERENRKKALKLLENFIPELVKLRNAVPTGSIDLDIVVSLKVKVNYEIWSDIGSVDILNKNGDEIMWGHQVIDRDELRKMPKMKKIVNCPHRKAYLQRCKEIADMLGLDETSVENQVYFAISDNKKGHKK